MKEFGGVVRNWQLHHLSFSKNQIENVYPGKNLQAIVTILQEIEKRVTT